LGRLRKFPRLADVVRESEARGGGGGGGRPPPPGRNLSVAATREISSQIPSVFSRTSLFQKRMTVIPLLSNKRERRCSRA
jgi:hypothetical protein